MNKNNCCEKCDIYLDYKDAHQCSDGDCPCHKEQCCDDCHKVMGQCVSPGCDCHLSTQEEGRVKPHEELFSHRNKKCKCFAPHKESEFIELGKALAGYIWEHKEYDGDGYFPISKKDAENRMERFVANLLSSERSKIIELAEKMKEAVPSEADDSIWPIIVDKVNGKLSDLISKLKSDEK